jgi:hypothetical protein
MRELLREASKAVGGHKFSLHFLLTEWEQVVDAWQLETWESYRDVARLGRKTRLPEAQRAVLWSIFERVRDGLKERKLTTHAGLFTALASALAKGKHLPFDFAVVDEAQDITVSGLRLLAALGGSRPNALFFAGDLGQRIFQQPFSWKSLGVDIRGRSRTLRINYRTSHQIRQQAERLLGPELSDVDGNSEDRSDTVSVFNGPPPVNLLSSATEDALRRTGRQMAKCPLLPFVLVFRGADRGRGRCGRRISVLGAEGGAQEPVTLEALNEGVGIDDHPGDLPQDVRVDLHLAVQVAGQVGQVVQRAAQVFRERGQVRVGAGQSGIGGP